MIRRRLSLSSIEAGARTVIPTVIVGMLNRGMSRGKVSDLAYSLMRVLRGGLCLVDEDFGMILYIPFKHVI